MKAVLTYLGRMLSLSPAPLGKQFEDSCVVTRMIQVNACAENGWRQSRKPEDHTLYWYDTQPDGTPVFVTYSGYGYRIQAELTRQGHEVEVRDFTPCGLPDPDLTRLQGISWRGSQPDVVCKLLANRCGVIDCPTGFGKSFIIRMIVRAYPNSLIGITVPSTDVAKEIYESLVPELGYSVGIVGGGKHKQRRVTVAVTHSLLKLDPNINLLMVDEAHSTLTPNFIDMFNRFPRAKFQAFTATPKGRSDGADGFMEALFGPVIHHVPYQEAVESGNICQLRYRVYESKIGPDVTGMTNKVAKDRVAVWRNKARNDLIAHAVRRAEITEAPDPQILIMVEKTEHAFLLQQVLPEFVVVTGELDDAREDQLRRAGSMQSTQSAPSKDDCARMKKEFSAGTLRKVIATYKWSKGVNFLGLDVLVRAEGTSTEIASGQVPGRLSRKGHDGKKEYGLLIDFNDVFSTDMKARSANRFKVYKRNGWIYEVGS